MAGTDPILALSALRRTFRSGSSTIDVLAGADVQVNAGEVVALLGPSGSGKSTLLACAAGLDQPDSGTVRVCGQDLSTLDESGRAALRRTRIGIVFQDFRLFAELTAEENVRVPLELQGRSDAVAIARHWLDRVGLSARRQHVPGRLSGGERQRVALARALAGGPSLILADEPTGSLDRATGDAVGALLCDLARDAGAAVLLVTHDERLAARADRRLAMIDGRVDVRQ